MGFAFIIISGAEIGTLTTQTLCDLCEGVSSLKIKSAATSQKISVILDP
jgi:hypothetical protein